MTFSTNGNAGKRNTKTPARTYTWTEPDTCWTWNSVRARQTFVTQQTRYQHCLAEQPRLLHFCGLFYKTKRPTHAFVIVHAAFIYDCAIGGFCFFFTPNLDLFFCFSIINMIVFPFLKKMLYLKVFIQSLALVLVTNYKLIVCIAKKKINKYSSVCLYVKYSSASSPFYSLMFLEDKHPLN